MRAQGPQPGRIAKGAWGWTAERIWTTSGGLKQDSAPPGRKSLDQLGSSCMAVKSNTIPVSVWFLLDPAVLSDYNH